MLPRVILVDDLNRSRKLLLGYPPDPGGAVPQVGPGRSPVAPLLRHAPSEHRRFRIGVPAGGSIAAEQLIRACIPLRSARLAVQPLSRPDQHQLDFTRPRRAVRLLGSPADRLRHCAPASRSRDGAQRYAVGAAAGSGVDPLPRPRRLQSPAPKVGRTGHLLRPSHSGQLPQQIARFGKADPPGRRARHPHLILDAGPGGKNHGRTPCQRPQYRLKNMRPVASPPQYIRVVLVAGPPVGPKLQHPIGAEHVSRASKSSLSDCPDRSTVRPRRQSLGQRSAAQAFFFALPGLPELSTALLDPSLTQLLAGPIPRPTAASFGAGV